MLKTKQPQSSNTSSSCSSSRSSSQEEPSYTIDIEKVKQVRQKGQRSSVSAEVYGLFNQKNKYTPPSFPKDSTQSQAILHKLRHSFMFSNLEEESLQLLVEVMEIKNYKSGDKVIVQGEEGLCLYVVDSGQLKCTKRFGQSQDETFLKHYISGEAFGELALLYNAKRAANITAETDCVLLSLDRESFKHIVQDATIQTRNKYEGFINQVEILQTIDPYEKLQICDVVKNKSFKHEEKIVSQGEKGNIFYILMEGEAYASKNGQVVMNYKAGEYFGELALLKEIPRQADVIAKGESVQVLCIERASFQRLLGPLEELLKRNTEKYSKYM